ncbi:MAG: substrate-binding domain-containing protein [Hydrogenobacter sp.]
MHYNRVKSYRLKKGLSQEDLSTLTEIPRTTISAIETGKALPSVDYALRLAKALGCTVEELFSPEEEPIIFESFKEGPFISAKMSNREVLYPAGFMPPDGFYSEGEIQRLNKNPLPTYVFAGCDVSVNVVSYQLLEEGIRFVVIHASSERALRLLKEGWVHIAGIHLGSFEENLKVVSEYLGRGFRLAQLFSWEEGVALREGLEAKSLQHLKNSFLLWLLREKGTGARKVFEEIKEDIRPVQWKEVSGSHRDIAFSLKNCFGDVGITTRLFAVEYGLGFFSVKREDYCICYREELEEDKYFQRVINALTSKVYRKYLENLPGYYTSKDLEIANL